MNLVNSKWAVFMFSERIATKDDHCSIPFGWVTTGKCQDQWIVLNCKGSTPTPTGLCCVLIGESRRWMLASKETSSSAMSRFPGVTCMHCIKI
jgi:hypothetical protein